MSRTRHVRPRRRRSNPHTAAKKPDEGRRFERRWNKVRDVDPARDERRRHRTADE